MRSSLLVALTLALLPLVHGPRQATAGEETLQERRERLEQMSDVEKTRLLQKKHRFDELSPEEQDRLRQLQRDLAADPRCSHLRGVLERYSDWLKTLTPVERAALTKLSSDERLSHVKELVSTQDAKRFRMMVGGFLNPTDLEAIRAWLDQFVTAHAAEILATVPDSPRFQEVKADFNPEKHLSFLRFWFIRHDVSELPQPTRQDEQHLRELLSQDARQVLDKANSAADRSQIIQNWMRAAVFASRVPPPVSQQELERFAKEELSESERVALESLPRDRMFRELRSKYYQKRLGPGGNPGMWMGPGGRRGPGGPPGFEGPPPEADDPGPRRGRDSDDDAPRKFDRQRPSQGRRPE